MNLLMLFFGLSVVLNGLLIWRFEVVGRLHKAYGNWLRSGKLSQQVVVDSDTPVAFYLIGSTVTDLTTSSRNSVLEIPADLIIKPDSYKFAGQTYDLVNQGLYRIVITEKVSLQRIVYDGDIDALLSAISWIVTHGNVDDELSDSKLTQKALHDKLLLTCGNVCRWAHRLLSDLGIRSRIVSSITLETWNSYDNGHTMLEVYREHLQKWVLYDLDFNSYFCGTQDGKPLSFLEFYRAVQVDSYDVCYLSLSFRSEVGSYVSPQGFCYAFLAEAVRTNFRQWYRRIMQVPMIQDDETKRYLFMNVDERKRIEAYFDVYRYVPEKEFMARFYGESAS